MDDLFSRDKGKAARPIWCLSPAALETWQSDNAGARRAWVENNQFTGGAGQILLLPDKAGGIEGVLLGLGKTPDPFALAALPSKLPKGQYRITETCPETIRQHAALSWALGTYRFSQYLSKPKAREWPQLVIEKNFDSDAVLRLKEAVFLARNLINTPAEDMGPEALETQVARVAQAHKAELDVIIGDALLPANFPLVHVVGRAAQQLPRVLDLRWGDTNAPEICLIGKGVCFDTGGLNLKTGSYMDLMKKDMGGAAIALGLAQAIMAANLPVRLRLLIGAVENAIGPGAFRPGDIFPSRKGITVEIGNTDAEGRLVLADLLTAASETSPDLILNFATLTGAARVALGPELVPFYTRQDELAQALNAQGMAQNDPLWRLPLWAGYDSWLESAVADVNHISSSPMAGSITAALFLGRFVDEATAWAHFDVYGWSVKSRPAQPVGAAAQALRACFAYLEERYGHRT
jgi:leucyl aminopeptidase